MFTGLIEEIGVVERLDKRFKNTRLYIRRPSSFDDIKIGDSISVNGVCLTIADLDTEIMIFDVMHESLQRTSLMNFKKDDRVNLERALKADQRLGGHFVAGHVDCKTKIKDIEFRPDRSKLEMLLPKEYRRYIVSKGSVAIDGVSLTVAEVFSDSFSVYLIPHTLKKTTLSLKKKGESVNMEVDLLAKHIVRAKDDFKEINMSFLKEHGFA